MKLEKILFALIYLFSIVLFSYLFTIQMQNKFELLYILLMVITLTLGVIARVKLEN